MSIELERPLPRPTPTSRPFWDGLREGCLRLQRCDDCGAWVFYPRNRCHRCLSAALTWHDVSGAATLYTFTIARQPTSPHFVDDVPQFLAVVELAEGVRMTSTLVDVEESDIRVGMALAPVFDVVDEKVTMLRFRPA
jgi:uncharacterized OB-fold protein